MEVRQPEFGRRLATLRRSRGLTQKDLAGTAVTASYVSLLENGVRIPTLDVVVKLAAALKVPFVDLVGNGVAGSPAATSTQVRATLLLSEVLARAAADNGDVIDAERRYRVAYDQAMDNGLIEDAVGVGTALQEVYRLQHRPTERAQLLHELLPLADKLAVPEIAAMLTADLAAASRDLGRDQESVELAERAVTMARGTTLPTTGPFIRMMGILISAYCESGRHDAVPDLVIEMLTAADGHADLPTIGRAHWVAAIAYLQIRRPELVADEIRVAQDALVSTSTSVADWARFTMTAAGILLDVNAGLDEVKRYRAMADSAAIALNHPADLARLTLLGVKIALAENNLDPAIALSEPDEGLPINIVLDWLSTKGDALIKAGRISDGRAVIEKAAVAAEADGHFPEAAQLWRRLASIGR